MDIEGAKSIKAETETTIRDLLIDFSTKTGLVINGVDFEMTETRQSPEISGERSESAGMQS